MYDFGDLIFDVTQALEYLEQASYLGRRNVTSEDWQDMNDYLDNILKAIHLVEIPESIEKEYHNYEKAMYEAECLADRNSL